jgi:hypothetical protein
MGPVHLPGGLDNMTNVFLPLLPPNNSTPPSYAGSLLAEAVCDAASPDQRFTLPAGGSGPIVHAASALCVVLVGDSLLLGTCAGAPAWQALSDGAITTDAGGSCISWNAENDLPHQPGNPVIPYACGSPPAWNEQWITPAAGATGVVQALLSKGGGPSNLCVAAQRSGGGADWTLPWLDAWSLKDY